LPADVGFARAQKRSDVRDRIEQEKIDFFDRVRNAYLERAKQDPKRIKIIDASKSLEEVKMQIETAVSAFCYAE
jgi:dTMP kinase